MVNPAFAWSHADYPPFYPASAGALWSFYDPADRALAKALGSGLTFGAVLLIGLLLVVVAPRRLRWPAAVLGGLVGVGLFGIGHGNGTAGHVDLLWAASFGAAALALLVAPLQRDITVLGALSAVAAALTKNEAVPALLLLIVLVAIRHRGRLRWQWRWQAGALLFGMLGPTALWMAEMGHFVKRQNESINPSGAKGLLLGDAKYTDRVGPTLTAMWHQVGPTVLVTLAITVVALAGLGRHRRRLGLGSWLWLPLSALGTAAAFLLTYAIGPYEVHWWLSTSIDRTMIVVRLLLVVEVAVWLIVGVAVWLNPQVERRPTGADRVAGEDGDARSVVPMPAAPAMTGGSAGHRSRSAPITNRLLRPN
jgi:hypothetical protein